MTLPSGPVRVLIASALEREYVDRIAAVDPAIDVLYAPELLPVPRYQADHHGPPRDLTAADLGRWRSMLSAAQVSFDFDWLSPADMKVNCPDLRWVQATSSGIGQFLEKTGLNRTDITFTTAAGVHAVPLAAFALAGGPPLGALPPPATGGPPRGGGRAGTDRPKRGGRLLGPGGRVWGVARD